MDSFHAPTLDGIVTRAVVRRAEAHRLCEGHFPGDPILPGAYLAGLMAELAGWLVAASDNGQAVLDEVVRCVFRARVQPAADILIEAQLHTRGAGSVLVDAEVHAGSECAARGTFRFGRRR